MPPKNPDEVLDDEPVVLEEPEAELEVDAEPNPEGEAEADQVEAEGDGEESLTIRIEGEPDEDEDEGVDDKSRFIRQKAREREREAWKRAKEAEAEVARMKSEADANKPKPLKPLREFFATDEAFGDALLNWRDSEKREADQAAKRKAEYDREVQEHETVKTKFFERAKTLKVTDFDGAVETIKEKLSLAQQGILMHAFDNAPEIAYALSKAPKRLAELAEITNLPRYTVALADIARNVKVEARKPPPVESRVDGGRVVTLSAQHIEKLRDQARRTGDYDAYHAAKFKLEKKA